MTKGSCSSLALAYAANKAGYDVLDFRGGESCSIFSTNSNIIELTKLANGEIVKNFNDFKGAAELVQKIEKGKEYYFATGKHAAIIRKSDNGFEYLELQSAVKNGFKPLNNDVLKKRFKCQKSYSVSGFKLEVPNMMFDIDALKNNSEFEKLFGYINTSEALQQKGKLGETK